MTAPGARPPRFAEWLLRKVVPPGPVGHSMLGDASVSNFWVAYDRLATSTSWEDSVRVITEEYFEPASPGLQEFIRIRLEEPAKVLRALTHAPRYYAAVRAQTLRTDAYTVTMREGLQALHRLYPATVFPPIYFLMSAFISQGTFTDDGLYIGIEMVSADASTPRDELPPALQSVDLTPAVVPCIVVHELLHVEDFEQFVAQSRYDGGRSR